MTNDKLLGYGATILPLEQMLMHKKFNHVQTVASFSDQSTQCERHYSFILAKQFSCEQLLGTYSMSLQIDVYISRNRLFRIFNRLHKGNIYVYWCACISCPEKQ